MRFTADYDSEEEEFPVDDAQHAKSPGGTVRDAQSRYWSDGDDNTDEEDSEFVDILAHHQSPSRDAWVIHSITKIY